MRRDACHAAEPGLGTRTLMGVYLTSPSREHVPR